MQLLMVILTLNKFKTPLTIFRLKVAYSSVKEMIFYNKSDGFPHISTMRRGLKMSGEHVPNWGVW